MSRFMTRRQLLGTVGVGMASLGGCVGDSGGGGESVSIGMLQPLSGDLSYYSSGSRPCCSKPLMRCS